MISASRFISACDAEDRKAKEEGRAPDYTEAATIASRGPFLLSDSDVAWRDSHPPTTRN